VKKKRKVANRFVVSSRLTPEIGLKFIVICEERGVSHGNMVKILISEFVKQSEEEGLHIEGDTGILRQEKDNEVQN
jgi:hypothetical protein